MMLFDLLSKKDNAPSENILDSLPRNSTGSFVQAYAQEAAKRHRIKEAEEYAQKLATRGKIRVLLILKTEVKDYIDEIKAPPELSQFFEKLFTAAGHAINGGRNIDVTFAKAELDGYVKQEFKPLFSTNSIYDKLKQFGETVKKIVDANLYYQRSAFVEVGADDCVRGATVGKPFKLLMDIESDKSLTR